jgi:Domain of unknown function (DUF4252)
MTRQAIATIAPLFLLALAVPLAGCGGGSPSVDTVRWEIEHRIPEARFEREFHLRLGRLSLGLARRIVHLADPGDPDTAVLDDVRRLEVATYRVLSLPDLDRHLNEQTRFEQKLAESGWSAAVKTRDDDSRTWVFVRGDQDGKLSNLYVVSLEPDELTLVRIDGHLDHAMAMALAEHPRKLAREVGAEDGGAL